VKKKAGTIRIFDNPYVVTVEDNVGKDGTRMGETCYSDRWIKIHSAMRRDHVISTLGHEIGHEVISEGGTINALDDNQQEIACNIAGKVAEILFKNISFVEKVVKMSGEMK
jgi:hypothetical protein